MSAPSDADLANGRRLVADLDHAQWQLGDLAIKVAELPTKRGKHDPNRKALDAFAEHIGIAPQRLAEYRSVAAAWSAADRIDGVAWALHRGLVGRDDRAERLRAFVEACRSNGETPTRDRLRDWSPHPARPDEGRKITIPATLDEAEERLAELGENMARLTAEADDTLVVAVLAHCQAQRIDPNDGVAVARALALNGLNVWALMEHGHVEDILNDPRDDKAAGEAWLDRYSRWSRRQDPVGADPWEDRP